MINREDMLELTRRMTPARSHIDRIAGAYYDAEGYIDGTFNTHFLKLSTAEKTKNLELAKAVLQAETNKQLKDYRIPETGRKPGSIWQLLDGIKESGLQNDAFLQDGAAVFHGQVVVRLAQQRRHGRVGPHGLHCRLPGCRKAARPGGQLLLQCRAVGRTVQHPGGFQQQGSVRGLGPEHQGVAPGACLPDRRRERGVQEVSQPANFLKHQHHSINNKYRAGGSLWLPPARLSPRSVRGAGANTPSPLAIKAHLCYTPVIAYDFCRERLPGVKEHMDRTVWYVPSMNPNG